MWCGGHPLTGKVEIVKHLLALGFVVGLSGVASAQVAGEYFYTGYLVCSPDEPGCSEVGNTGAWVHYTFVDNLTYPQCYALLQKSYKGPNGGWAHCDVQQ